MNSKSNSIIVKCLTLAYKINYGSLDVEPEAEAGNYVIT